MSLLNYGFTNSKYESNDCEVILIKRAEPGTGASNGKSFGKKSKSPSKSPGKGDKQSPKSSSSSSPKITQSQKSTPGSKIEASKKLSPATSKKSPVLNSNSKILGTKKTSPSEISKQKSPKEKNKTKSPISGRLDDPFIFKKTGDVSLPYQRIKMIMKSCPDVEIVNQESLHVIAKATELFIQHLTLSSIKTASSLQLDYESLSDIVHNNDTLEFLKETIPKKITWDECQKILAVKKAERKEKECW